MTNSADPDQLLFQKPTDLDLHCLLRQSMSCSAREGLKQENITLEHVILVLECHIFTLTILSPVFIGFEQIR